MRDLFRELPEACDNTLWIAERANVEIEFGNVELPDFPLPAGFTSADDYLRHLVVRRGARALRRAAAHRRGRAPRLRATGHRRHGLRRLLPHRLGPHPPRPRAPHPGRARAAARRQEAAWRIRSSIVDLDPLKYGLIFERFLNPGRKSMPDIDMDFDERYRGELIRYAAERYGSDHVAQIVTFSTIKARAAVRDAARVLGYPYQVGDRIAKAMPPLVMGRDTPLYACLEVTPGYEDGYKAGERAAGDVQRPIPTPRRSWTSPRASRVCAARTASTPPRS